MLYRLLTGPFDIPVLMQGRDIGNARLQATRLTSKNRRIFFDAESR